MKKEYSKPLSKVVTFTDEEFCESITVNSKNAKNIGSDAKEREMDEDFSDEESIW